MTNRFSKGPDDYLVLTLALTMLIGGVQPGKAEGIVTAWGDNVFGQLGNGTNTASNTPVSVLGLTGVVAVAAFGDHSLALKSNGMVWTWGWNNEGQLGNGTNANSNVPVAVSGIPGVVVAIAGGLSHSLALTSDHKIWAWGRNIEGQLGNGTFTGSNIPVPVSGLTEVMAIAAGGAHSLALKNDGSVWAWGQNFFGQLGIGTRSFAFPGGNNLPAQVSTLSSPSAISAGGLFSMALASGGSGVEAWGYDLSGQVGNGTNTFSINQPVPVSDLTNVGDIASGSNHGLALKNDHTIWAWGYNRFGQLGNGTNTDSNVPVAVSLTEVTGIARGFNHSLALKSDGTVWAWGANLFGALGNGTNTNSNMPVQVSGLTGVLMIAGGDVHSLALVTPQGASTLVMAQVQALIAAGTLTGDQGAGLTSKLNAIIAKLNNGQIGPACNQLSAFVNQVNAFVYSGVLTAAQGQALINATTTIKTEIGC